MDLVELDQNGDCSGNVSAVQLLSLGSSDANDIFGQPDVCPRVGDQYQAEIPPLLAQPANLSCTQKPINAENTTGVPFNFLIGLSIPITWINKEVENLNHTKLEFLGDSNSAFDNRGLLEAESVRETQILLKDENLQINGKTSDATAENVIGIGEFSKPALEDKIHQHRGTGYCLVPGSVGDSWSDIEKASFLLGLYIFEKNFVQVKRFIEHKNMGDILLYYYGKFYRSPEYCRWSDCRKMRSRKCVYRQRIFSGMRQPELLSRLAPHVSEECQNALSEVFKTFGEGKMSLEEYVFFLKSMVGINILVEAVGIEKGKQDLIGIAMEPPRSNQATSMRSEIPTGKDCSLLAPKEIIKFLTGGYRLSKARSSDLFWEAVWPRLLARGWNSLEPKGQNYVTGSNHSLVFLIPGVNKFSRRRLVKGNHYFDSITDVLSKVASEPGLLEDDIAENEGNRSKEECGWNSEMKLERDTLPVRQRHSYLQPRNAPRNTNVMKFTIVDTSLDDGKSFRVRELRALPSEISKTLTSTSLSEDSDEDDSEVSTDKSDTADAMLLAEEETNNAKPRMTTFEGLILSDKQNIEFSNLKPEMATSHPDSTGVPLNNANNHDCQEKQLSKAVYYNFSQKLKQDNLDYIAPTTKRHRKLTYCSHAEASHDVISFPVVHRFEQEMNQCYTDIPDLVENNLSQVGLSQDKLSTSSPKGRSIDSNEDFTSVQCPLVEHISAKPQPRTLIDLNVPQAPPDCENGIFVTGINGEQDDCILKAANDLCTLKASEVVPTSKQQPNINSRRQSTRNRPPTVRALEALANGFLTVNRRQKSKGTSPRENSRSRPSRRARNSLGVKQVNADVVALRLEEGGNGV